MKKRISNNLITRFLLLLLLSVPLAGCELIGAVGGGLAASGLSLLGVTPDANFRDNGQIKVAMLPTDNANNVLLGNLQAMGLQAEVENEDGTTSQCGFVDEETEVASKFNSVALLIDDSGSMGRSYEPDVCKTCPRDPKNERAEAAKELADVVLNGAPDSQIAVLDFGPDPDPGAEATRLLADFSNDIENVGEAIQLVDGTQEVGTPLWDALAETITALNANAVEQDSQRGGEGDETSTDNVKRYLIVLSDGDDTESETHTLESVIALAQANNIPIYAVGLGPAAVNNAVAESNAEDQVRTVQRLQQLAEATGGFYASVKSAAQLRELYEQVGRGMTEGYKTATFDCDEPNGNGNGNVNPEPTDPSTTNGPRHVRGNLRMGSLISVPFDFLEPN